MVWEVFKCPDCMSNVKQAGINHKLVCKVCGSAWDKSDCLFVVKMCPECGRRGFIPELQRMCRKCSEKVL